MMFVLLFLFNVLLLSKAESEVTAAQLEYCNRPWPSLTLFLPVGLRENSTRNNEWSNIFLTSLMMHWPVKRSNISVIIMLDLELKDSQLQKTHVDALIESKKHMNNFPPIEVKYHDPGKNVYLKGHDRQQHMMFYPELYTTSEYVGFTDTDCMFQAGVDREDIFENGKPVVHGRIGILPFMLGSWAKATYMALGLEEPMACMTYFPVVVKVAHMKEFRAHMQGYMGAPFDAAFLHIAKFGYYSQFNLMCTFLFWKKKDEYTWIIHDMNPEWGGVHDPKPVFGQWSEKYVYPNGSFTPKPQIATHERYHGGFEMNQTLIRSLCHTKPHDNAIGLNCTNYLNHFKYHNEMHIFEDADYTKSAYKVTDLINIQQERMKRFEHCDMSYGTEAFNHYFNGSGYTKHDFHKLLFISEKTLATYKMAN